MESERAGSEEDEGSMREELAPFGEEGYSLCSVS